MSEHPYERFLWDRFGMYTVSIDGDPESDMQATWNAAIRAAMEKNHELLRMSKVSPERDTIRTSSAQIEELLYPPGVSVESREPPGAAE